MFGANPVAEDTRSASGQLLRVVKGSPFYTIQGEGPHAGEPAIFLRLHGCSLRCTWCDTSFSDQNDPTVPLDNLVDQILHFDGHTCLLVITGGEPCRQNIGPLITSLYNLGFTIQVETAGIYWVQGLEIAEIVCSPKTPKIDTTIYSKAAAFKYVISSSMKFKGYLPVTATQPGARPAALATPRPGARVYLSPMDEGDDEKNRLNRKKVAELALRYGVRAGVQLHKILGVEEPI